MSHQRDVESVPVPVVVVVVVVRVGIDTNTESEQPANIKFLYQRKDKDIFQEISAG